MAGRAVHGDILVERWLLAHRALATSIPVDWTKQRDVRNVAGAVCKKCGAKTQGGKFCHDCGEPLNAKKGCRECGHEAEGNPKFCPECGQKY